ncbi:MAG TPA: Gfo/Idh/MocA family oxidoreductase [Tepidisphaeraceae bacterium]|nr:Gfo/Idh/MocA family oxidoreductase [Tepidisphaeraceae bacterium]
MRIGYVDFKLENYHANVFLKLFREQLKDRGATVAGCFGLDQETARAWSAKNNVPLFSSVRELAANVDAFMVLAPGNPDTHWTLCEMTLPLGKPTYVDKTFAPDLATAKKIFALAGEHHVPMQTTSALRYANVQDELRQMKQPLRHMIAWGGGRSFGEYAIHPVELIVSCMGPDALSLMRRGNGDQSQLLINFSDDRTAVANVYTNSDTPFAAALSTAQETRYVRVDDGKIFLNTATAILDFFEAKKPNIDQRESLMIRRILDVAEDPGVTKGFVRL